MTKRSTIPPMLPEVVQWRRLLHQNPGLMYEEHFASAFVTEKLTAWGIPFKQGLGKTGIVGIIEGRQNTSGKTIGLRGDMDALPIHETSGQPWASKIPGLMHACGHDGHTANLLGTAKYLNETRNFDGRVLLIFQPAEEGGRGAFAMMQDGLFKDDLKCDAVYGLHNWPTMPFGTAGIREGALMAAVDNFSITIHGIGGHAAYPARCIDPIVVGANLVTSMQTIVSRMVPAQEMAVLSITNFKSGTGASNVRPESAEISGTVRTFSNVVRQKIEHQIRIMTHAISSSYGTTATIKYENEIDAVINSEQHAHIAAEAMGKVIGLENVDLKTEITLAGDDFGGMLAAVPGAYIFIGQGLPDATSPHSRGLHHPGYDFNDDILATSIDYFAELVESSLPLK
jgi:hippurate hydrolase